RGGRRESLDELVLLALRKRGRGVAQALGELADEFALRPGLVVVLILVVALRAEETLDAAVDVFLRRARVLVGQIARFLAGEALAACGDHRIGKRALFFGEQILETREFLRAQLEMPEEIGVFRVHFAA